MPMIRITLTGKDGTKSGEYDRDLSGSIPDLVTLGGRVFVLRRISSGKTSAWYYESDIYDMNVVS